MEQIEASGVLQQYSELENSLAEIEAGQVELMQV